MLNKITAMCNPKNKREITISEEKHRGQMFKEINLQTFLSCALQAPTTFGCSISHASKQQLSTM
jgi:hypothetical protein